MAFSFNAENKKRFEEVVKRYPKRMAAMLPTLWLAQEQNGWVSTEVMEYVSSLLEVPPSKVYEAVTFYTMFHQEPVGKYHFQVCRTLSCQLCGAETITRHLEGRLGIKVGETSSDGKFSLTEVECLGSCGTAPMMQLNDDYQENLTPEKLDKILESLK